MQGSTAVISVRCRSVPNFYKQEKMMTKFQLAKHALRLWNVPHVPKSVNRSNARKWLRSVELLGEKWLLAKKVQRVQ